MRTGVPASSVGNIESLGITARGSPHRHGRGRGTTKGFLQLVPCRVRTCTVLQANICGGRLIPAWIVTKKFCEGAPRGSPATLLSVIAIRFCHPFRETRARAHGSSRNSMARTAASASLAAGRRPHNLHASASANARPFAGLSHSTWPCLSRLAGGHAS